MSDLDDLLPKIVGGDARAFGVWVSQAEEPLRRSLRSFASSVDTEAVLQESLLRVWQLAPKVQTDGKGNSLLRFALRVARNCAIDEARRNRRQIPQDPLDGSDLVVVEPSLPDPLLRRVIEDCREKLPNKPSLAFTLRLETQGGTPDRVLAARADMALNTFLKNVGRARKLLIDCLKRSGVEWKEAAL